MVQHESMGTVIRKQEPNYTLTKTKEWWIDFLVFLVEFKDRAATDEIEKVVGTAIGNIREFVLSKEQGEFSLQFHKVDALDLFIHLSDFKNQDQSPEIIQTTADDIKAFLTKRGNDDE